MLGPVLIALTLSSSAPASPVHVEISTDAAGSVASLRRNAVDLEWSSPSWSFLRFDGEARNLRPTGRALPLPAGKDVLVVGVDFEPREERIAPAAWLVLTGEEIEEPRSVRRYESAKAIVREEPGGPSALTLTKTGQRVEIRPLVDPTSQAAFGDFAVAGYAPGGAGGGRLTLYHQESGDRREARLDDQGLGRVQLGLSGSWKATLVVTRHLEEDRWMLAIATMNFEVQEKEGR